MEKNIRRITSFSVDHDYIGEGIYISRIDGDITTYDLRMRKPNGGDYLDDLGIHSLEHMLATYLRNGDMGEDVIYFGPMGCRTGFYLLVRNADNARVLASLTDALRKTAYDAQEMFGNSRKECGNFAELSLDAAKAEAVRYLSVLSGKEHSFKYDKLIEE